MRLPLIAMIFVLFPGPLLAGSFDLSLDDTNGERAVVIARANGGAFAAAAGGEDLVVLRGEDAERARARLARVDADDDLEGAAGDDGKTKKKKKIVIHKMDVDEDGDGAGEEEERIVRVIKKTDSERREETLLDDEEALIRGEDAPEGAVERRVIRLKGADEARAIKFIDEIEGLDIGEKAEMKAAVGL